MILLDTDHVTVLQRGSGERGQRLFDRLDALPAGTPIAASVVSFEEQMRGWLASIAKERDARRQVPAYRKLAELSRFFAKFALSDFDEQAADQFEELRAARVRIGAMDLKIAATALVHGATLLTANRQDFERVPGLHFENWIDP